MRTERRTVAILAVAAMAGVLLAGGWGSAQAANPPITRTHLKVGEKAPNFKLISDHWLPTTLDSELGKHNVLLAFYVLAFTPG